MHKLVEKLKLVLPYISPYLSSVTCGSVQNTTADAARSLAANRTCYAADIPYKHSYGSHFIFVAPVGKQTIFF